MAMVDVDTLIGMLRANPPIQGGDILAMRAHMDAVSENAPLAPDVSYVPVDAGGVPAEWTETAGASPDRAVVYFHGGGYGMGGVHTHRLLVGSISRASGARVLSVDYRLAPEHPYPAAVEDALSAYRFARGTGLAPASIAFAGDSAGGGLTAATLLAARDAGDPLPAAAVCISPWTDLALTGASLETKSEEDPMIRGRRDMRILADAYLGGADATSPTASPLYGDLTGLPPLLVHVGGREMLLDDSTRFAERAKAAGVEVEIEVWPEMFHVWHAFETLLPEAGQAIAKIGDFLRKRLA
jgi:acetyl esterase/lipase